MNDTVIAVFYGVFYVLPDTIHDTCHSTTRKHIVNIRIIDITIYYCTVQNFIGMRAYQGVFTGRDNEL